MNINRSAFNNIYIEYAFLWLIITLHLYIFSFYSFQISINQNQQDHNIEIKDMTEAKSQPLWSVVKVAGIAALTLALNTIITSYLSPKKTSFEVVAKHSLRHSQPSIRRFESQEQLGAHKDDYNSKHALWGSLKLLEIKQNDGLLQQLQLMTKLMCPYQKVNNLIVDLQLHDVQTIPCPLVAHQIKRHKQQPFLMPDSLVPPGEFVIQNCVFRAGQSIETEKKFMRAGPRSTQYFDPKTVRADVVCLGKAAPGINNLIREIVTILKEIYKVDRVTGIRFSLRGYYNNDMIDLTPQLVQTIHHRGGSFLGLASAPCFPQKIVDSLQQRGINQLYLIGGNDTIRHAIQIYKQIKRRQLNIALCVNLKAINKDIAYFDTCFGFQSAVEETQRFIEQGYALSKSNYNSAVFVKVPGRKSGFLAMDAVRAARNAQVCLVPEFGYDLYGERGLLAYIANRIQMKGHCIIVYSEGASYAARDVPEDLYDEILQRKEGLEDSSFDQFVKGELEKVLAERRLQPNSVFLFDTQNSVRTVPANSFDTKLCSQIALCSIQGLMCGFTNFAIGHFKNRVAMVPLDQMTHGDKYCLKVEDENWQRLLTTTNQPTFSSSLRQQ